MTSRELDAIRLKWTTSGTISPEDVTTILLEIDFLWDDNERLAMLLNKIEKMSYLTETETVAEAQSWQIQCLLRDKVIDKLTRMRREIYTT